MGQINPFPVLSVEALEYLNLILGIAIFFFNSLLYECVFDKDRFSKLN